MVILLREKGKLMSRRGENIRRRKDGRWEGRYIVDRNMEGKAVYRSVYGKTYLEAKGKLYSEKLKKAQQPRKKCKIMFQMVLEEWLKDNRIRFKASTYSKYDFIIRRHIIPELGRLPITEINTTRLNSYLEDKLTKGGLEDGEPLSASYVRTIALIINSAVNYAAAQEYCLPLKSKMHKPMVRKKDILLLDNRDYKILNRYCQEHLSVASLGVLIALHTGLRVGEICGLRWCDIDALNHLLYVNNTITRIQDATSRCKWVLESPKTDSSRRVIPISESLVTILMRMRARTASVYVISEKDGFINPRTFEYQFHQLLHSCNVRDVNFHALRHTFATRCVEGGMDIKTLSEILGHSNVSITLNTYVHSSLELKKAQIRKVEAYFDGGQI